MLAALLRNSLDAEGISQTDMAAACDRHRPEISEMCRRAGEPRAKRMTGADLMLVAVRSDTFWEGVTEMRRVLRGEK